MQNFLRAGGGGAGGGAERKRECERVNGEKAELASRDFLHDWGLVGVAAATILHMSLRGRTGLAACKVCVLARCLLRVYCSHVA
jgi:hypothetical protein